MLSSMIRAGLSYTGAHPFRSCSLKAAKPLQAYSSQSPSDWRVQFSLRGVWGVLVPCGTVSFVASEAGRRVKGDVFLLWG